MSKLVRVKDDTYKDIADISEFSKVPMTDLIGMAWKNFKTTKDYAVLKVLGRKD